MAAGDLGFVLGLVAQTLDAEHRVLWAAVAFFFDLEFLLPKGVVKGIALLAGIEAEALAEVHASAIRILAQQILDFPFDIGRRFLRPPAEVDVILHLQAAHVVFQHGKFFIHSQEKNPSLGTLAGVVQADYTTESKGCSARRSAGRGLGFGLHLTLYA